MATTATTFAPTVGFDHRPHTITGMAFGTLIMGFFGCIWLTMGLASAHGGTTVTAALVAVFALSIALPASKMLHLGRSAVRHAPPLTAGQEREQARMGRRFGGIFFAEGVLIFLAVNVLNNLHMEPYVVPAIAAIVGLHFLPLARLFKAPLYTPVGIVMVLAAAVSLLLPASIRPSAVGLAMGTIIWITCALVMRIGFSMMGELQAKK